MKVYKRLSDAIKAAAGGPYLRVGDGADKIYIVDISASHSIELVSPENAKGQRVIAGNVSLGHLDRLGNANHAAAARYERREDFHAFPAERRRGLLHRFINPDDEAAFQAARAAEREGA